MSIINNSRTSMNNETPLLFQPQAESEISEELLIPEIPVNFRTKEKIYNYEKEYYKYEKLKHKLKKKIREKIIDELAETAEKKENEINSKKLNQRPSESHTIKSSIIDRLYKKPNSVEMRRSKNRNIIMNIKMNIHYFRYQNNII